jgi:hypothetical protein
MKVRRSLAALIVILMLGLVALAQQSSSPAQAATQNTQSGPPSATSGTPYTPQYKGDPAHSQDENLAILYMHTLLYAQHVYFKKHAHYAPSLYALAGTSSFTRRMVATDRGAYTVSFRGGAKTFSVQLTPKQFDAQHRAFWADQLGILHVAADEPATADSPVLKADE